VNFLKRKKDEPAPAPAPAVVEARGTTFDGYTEEWHLVGRMAVDGRLSDALNKREPIAISDVSWGSLDGSTPLVPAPGLQSVDPYDLIIVVAGASSLPPMTEEERTAHRIHKVHYEVALEAPPFHIVGTVAVYPGSDPVRLLDRSTDMFVPVVGARVRLGELALETGGAGAILVNRSYLRGVSQVDVVARIPSESTDDATTPAPDAPDAAPDPAG
jgi:hypothetical protein